MSKHNEYRNFETLSRNEAETIDYRIVVQSVEGSTTAIVAPHGGKIEPLTSELVRAIASEDYSAYAFEGIKPRDNRKLHITSPNFDEPKCLGLLASCDRVVAVHGLEGNALALQVGGRDQALGAKIDTALRAGGFASTIVQTGEYGGMAASNICNRGRSGAGVQLEIKAGLRDLLRQNPERFDAFVNCIRSAMSAT